MQRPVWGMVAAGLLATAAVAIRAEDRPEAAPAEQASGIDRENFDPAVRPQDDLYRHNNAGIESFGILSRPSTHHQCGLASGAWFDYRQLRRTG